MRQGKRLSPAEPLSETQARCRAEIARLPAALRALPPAARPFQAEVSPALRAFEKRVASDIARRE
jgi:hypothetical protein